MLLLPDGKFGYIGGPLKEKVDFVNAEIIDHVKNEENKDSDIEKIFSVIRGGMGIYHNYKFCSVKDSMLASKYFVNSENPEQWAYFDISNLFNNNLFNSNIDENVSLDKCNTMIYLKSYKKYVDKLDLHRASVKIKEVDLYYNGNQVSSEQWLELIKLNDERWYITGISTFPQSKEAFEVKKEVHQYVIDAVNGKLFNGELSGKRVQIGQIQFGEKDMTKFVGDIEKADCCKVYLKVYEGNKTRYYKMILNKINNNYWKPVLLREDKTSRWD